MVNFVLENTTTSSPKKKTTYTSRMLCGCASIKRRKKLDELSFYGDQTSQVLLPAPAMPRDMTTNLVGRLPLSSTTRCQGSVLGCDEGYPDWCVSNPLFASNDHLDDPDDHQVENTEDIPLPGLLKRSTSVPVLEFTEKQDTGDRVQRPAHRMYQQYKGQLRVSVYVNCGLLTVHVAEARHLQTSKNKACNSYVRLSISPDELGRTRCKTQIIRNRSDPAYDEKFSFELLDEDADRRLMISVWHKEKEWGSSEMLGCMSFGVRHILQKPGGVSGWYYLLSEYVGRRKHLHAKTSLLSETSTAEMTQSSLTIERVGVPNGVGSGGREHITMTDPAPWDTSYAVEMQRGEQGCGFTLTGGSPARVFLVEPGSPAEHAGIQPEDCVLSVNGQNVSRCTAETVAKLVRNCENSVRVEIGCRSRTGPQWLHASTKDASLDSNQTSSRSDYGSWGSPDVH